MKFYQKSLMKQENKGSVNLDRLLTKINDTN